MSDSLRRPTPPQALNYRRIVLFLVALVIVPSVLLSAIGVIMLVAGEERLNILLGILVLCFTGAVVSASSPQPRVPRERAAKRARARMAARAYTIRSFDRYESLPACPLSANGDLVQSANGRNQ